jgi:hypothetical protein
MATKRNIVTTDCKPPTGKRTRSRRPGAPLSSHASARYATVRLSDEWLAK